MLLLIILFILRAFISHIICFFIKNKNAKIDNLDIETYYDTVFDKKKKINDEIIESTINRVYQEKKNHTDEFYKLLIFLWGFQVASIGFLATLTTTLIDFSSFNLIDILLNIYIYKSNHIVITIILAIVSLIYIITIIQILGLYKKEGIIKNYLYHIVYLENKLGVNILGVFIKDLNNNIGTFSNQTVYECMYIILVFWEILISISFCIMNNITLSIINIGIILAILEIIQASFITIRVKLNTNYSKNLNNKIFIEKLNLSLKK